MLMQLSGFFLFGAAFTIHLFIWKIYIPTHQIRTLLLVFLLSFFTGVFVFAYFPNSNQFIEVISPGIFSEYVTLTTLFIALTTAYYFLYSGLIDEGPSLTFILNIAEAGKEGLDRSDLEGLVTKDTFIKSRMKFLVDQKFASKIGEKYVISRRGRVFLGVINKLRKWMNVSIKVG